MGFFGFMRAGEFTCPSSNHFDSEVMLTPRDVAVDQIQSPSLLAMTLKQSKTDPFRMGVTIFLGRTGNLLCPVVAVLAYLAIRPQSPGPLFIFSDGSYLTRDPAGGPPSRWFAAGWCGCKPVQWAQFQNWGRNNGGPSRN